MAKRKPKPIAKGKKYSIGQIQLEQIRELYLERCSTREIAAFIGCSHTSIHFHLNKTIKPEIEKYRASSKAEELARVDLLEKEAFAAKRLGDTEARKFIMWSIDYRSKVLGHYAPQRFDLGGLENIRVAGVTLEEFSADTVKEFLDVLQKTIDYHQSKKLLE